jgi:hypothetical protein
LSAKVTVIGTPWMADTFFNIDRAPDPLRLAGMRVDWCSDGCCSKADHPDCLANHDLAVECGRWTRETERARSLERNAAMQHSRRGASVRRRRA